MSRAILQALKQRKTAAVKGKNLLKKKRDAMFARFRSIQAEIRQAKLDMSPIVKSASWALTEAQFSAGDISGRVISSIASSCPDQPHSFLKTSTENLAGVMLPKFELISDNEGISSIVSSVAITGGSQRLKSAQKAYNKALVHLVHIASLQSCYLALNDVIRITSKRVNALEYVVIPKLEESIKEVETELEEQEREEFFRLKKVKDKKQRDDALAGQMELLQEELKRTKALADEIDKVEVQVGMKKAESVEEEEEEEEEEVVF
ncbi:ATPase, V1 complex, subunit D like protein [Aduncisulcus paluster]|uniref:ATPase, V1 complex, subunit D like protein n=1 Tax=Aduncisulcus paluster TaxID=2918883 RepID=A0ABQ5JVT5_9EUKA|nr:ATPase, V1 complex, subunit D like protein [Aduncisulcus paluster]